MRTPELRKFVVERHSIYLARKAGKPKPWTQDKFLQSYRFCNVYRELDTVTKWISDHWRTPKTDDPNLFFAMTLARLVNWPETMEELGYPLKWNPAQFVKIMQARKARGDKTFSGAYIVSTNGHAMDKAEYLAKFVLDPLWAKRIEMRPRGNRTDNNEALANYHRRLMRFDGLGSFIAGQVIADLKYAKGSPLSDAPDWHTWAASGPGSRRGLNRVMDYDYEKPWREDNWLADLSRLHKDLLKGWPKGWEPLHAQDLQNCLCEFDKYERTRLGQGRPRSTYPGKG